MPTTKLDRIVASIDALARTHPAPTDLAERAMQRLRPLLDRSPAGLGRLEGSISLLCQIESPSLALAVCAAVRMPVDRDLLARLAEPGVAGRLSEALWEVGLSGEAPSAAVLLDALCCACLVAAAVERIGEDGIPVLLLNAESLLVAAPDPAGAAALPAGKGGGAGREPPGVWPQPGLSPPSPPARR
jgi:hypothetical protein